MQELRHAVRALAKSPGFTAAATATLALGIGGNTAIFSTVERMVRPLPFRDARRLVRITDAVVAPGGGLYRAHVLPLHWAPIAQGTRSFDRASAQRPERLTWIGGEAAASIQGAGVSAGTFELLGISPELGRLFTPEEERAGDRSRVALVSDRFWKTRLGARPDVLGSPLRLADRTSTIVGVLPAGYRFPYSSDVWHPASAEPPDTRDLLVIARLAPGVALSTAQDEMTDLARRLEREGPPSLRGRGMDVSALKADLLGAEQRIPFALMAAVGFLLLLACANLASLLLARSVARQREIGIRAALGASRARQARQILAESLLLSAAGGALGLLLARAAAIPISALLPRALQEDLALPAPEAAPAVAAFALGLAALTALLFGVVPAWRSSHADPASVLSVGGRASSMSAATKRLLCGFVVAEIALATLLLSGAALMAADFLDRQNGDLGLEPRHLLAVEVPLHNAAEGSPDRRRALVAEILRAVAAIPGVSSVAVTTANPFSQRRWGVGVADERSADPTRVLSTVNLRLVTPGLFRTLGTPIVSGRDVSDLDREDSAAVAVVSRRLARRLWKSEDAVGKRLVRRAPDGSLVGMTVVGVAADVRDSGELKESLYLPYAQAASLEAADSAYVMVRGQGPSDLWAREAPRALGRVDPRLAAAQSLFMNLWHARSMRQNRVGTSIIASFAAFGLLLATIGIFATVSFVAAQRRPEIGVRIAVGASPLQVRRLILRQGVSLALAGTGIGLVLALAANGVLSSSIEDFCRRPGLCAAVAGALLLIATAASDLPARRAAAADVLRSLRAD